MYPSIVSLSLPSTKSKVIHTPAYGEGSRLGLSDSTAGIPSRYPMKKSARKEGHSLPVYSGFLLMNGRTNAKNMLLFAKSTKTTQIKLFFAWFWHESCIAAFVPDKEKCVQSHVGRIRLVFFKFSLMLEGGGIIYKFQLSFQYSDACYLLFIGWTLDQNWILVEPYLRHYIYF